MQAIIAYFVLKELQPLQTASGRSEVSAVPAPAGRRAAGLYAEQPPALFNLIRPST
jgi:hypothetical protein